MFIMYMFNMSINNKLSVAVTNLKAYLSYFQLVTVHKFSFHYLCLFFLLNMFLP